MAEGGLDQLVHLSGPDGQHANLRRLVCDLIEEYGRHTGHADLLREAVDGVVGEDPPAGTLRLEVEAAEPRAGPYRASARRAVSRCQGRKVPRVPQQPMRRSAAGRREAVDAGVGEVVGVGFGEGAEEVAGVLDLAEGALAPALRPGGDVRLDEAGGGLVEGAERGGVAGLGRVAELDERGDGEVAAGAGGVAGAGRGALVLGERGGRGVGLRRRPGPPAGT